MQRVYTADYEGKAAPNFQEIDSKQHNRSFSLEVNVLLCGKLMMTVINPHSRGPPESFAEQGNVIIYDCNFKRN